MLMRFRGCLFFLASLAFAMTHLSSVLAADNPAVGADLSTEGGLARKLPFVVLPRGSHARVPLSKDGIVSSETLALAQGLHLMPLLETVQSLYEMQGRSENKSDLLFAKQDLYESLFTLDLELDCAINRVEHSLVRANEIHAYLAEKRDKAIRLNTYANFISGGVTGIVSGGLNLGRVKEFTPNLIDTGEGFIQTSLSLWALVSQRGEHKVERGLPNILAEVVKGSDSGSGQIPASIWQFLNSVPSDSTSGASRREELINHWTDKKFGILRKRRAQDKEERIGQLTGTHAHEHKLTVNLLEDRIAMLMDLKATLSDMKANLLELSQFARGLRRLR